ncbi:MAG: ssDNA-binding domain-containing protein [Prevotellaceae bacterium]|jgi:antirestriction protein ArdC|nr:ssDNA-binding domain-containing protein [Prevotellaceae bacterium]
MASKHLDSKALQEFGKLMIEKIEQVEGDWHKPWIVSPAGLPRNAISGRPYNGLNDLMLFFHTEKMKYRVPAYLTYKQATDVGAYVRKGEKGLPVIYWGKYYTEKDNPKNTVTSAEYDKLAEYEKEKYRQKLILKEYTVFNVQQTNIPEEKPELWEKIQQNFKIQRYNDENGMFKSAGIDRMLENRSWLCPVNVKEGNRAFYAPMIDEITVPLKAQFEDGESFYSTLLHEMAHSTGAESRLNRDQKGYFGDEKYAKEELVAELTAALAAGELGISSSIREENAQYLKSWLETLKAEPGFILTVLSDVHKASNMIDGIVLKEEEKMKEAESGGITKGEEKTDRQTVIPESGRIADVFQPEKGQLYRYAVDKFTKDEIPKNELKLLGLKLSDLSATDTKNLLSGKETKALSLKSRKGDRVYATLSLHRNTDNSVNIRMKPVEQQQKHKLKI